MRRLYKGTEAAMSDVQRNVWRKGLISSSPLDVIDRILDDVTDSLGG